MPAALIAASGLMTFFPAYFGAGYFHSAAVTYDPSVTYPLVFATKAFPIFGGTKDAFTEQPVLFRSIGSVVDCLGFLNLAKTPTANIAWTCKPNTCRFEIVDFIKDLFRHSF